MSVLNLEGYHNHALEILLHLSSLQVGRLNPHHQSGVFYTEGFSCLLKWCEESGYSSVLDFIKNYVSRRMSMSELSLRARQSMDLAEVPRHHQELLARPEVLRLNFSTNDNFVQLFMERLGMRKSPDFCGFCDQHRPLNREPVRPVYYVLPVRDELVPPPSPASTVAAEDSTADDDDLAYLSQEPLARSTPIEETWRQLQDAFDHPPE